MAQGPSDTILVAIRITLRIRESKVRNRDPPDRRRFVLSECFYLLQQQLTIFYHGSYDSARRHLGGEKKIRAYYDIFSQMAKVLGENKQYS